jgi:hypothetical protein
VELEGVSGVVGSLSGERRGGGRGFYVLKGGGMGWRWGRTC